MLPHTTNIWKVNDVTWIVADTVEKAVELYKKHKDKNALITKVECIQMNVLIDKG